MAQGSRTGEDAVSGLIFEQTGFCEDPYSSSGRTKDDCFGKRGEKCSDKWVLEELCFEAPYKVSAASQSALSACILPACPSS